MLSLDTLNEKQREAVIQQPGVSSLVLAGAGSGKTSVLVHRIAWLIKQLGVSPWSIMAVTFTNKAANEMRRRLQAMLGVSVQGVWVGTFHGLSHKILRMHYLEAGLGEHFQILDSDDQLRIIKRLMKAMKVDDKKWSPKQAQWYINHKKDEGVRARHYEPDYTVFDRVKHKIYLGYEEYCNQEGLVDFSELLFRCHELLLNNDLLLKHYQQRFGNILVDEFQDTNVVQYAWLRLLSEGGCLMAVGDDDQSIYGWRGAVAGHVKKFSQEFSGVNIIRLEQNYRSTATILKASNALIEKNQERMGKNLWTDGKEGELVKLFGAYCENEEASFVVARVQEYKQQGLPFKAMAVLYRSNAQSRVLEDIFVKENIPFRIYGGQRFFERAEIKNALAYLRLINNKEDNTAFERAVNMPPRGVGEKTLQMLRDCANKLNCSLWFATVVFNEKNSEGRAAKALQSFLSLIDTMSRQAKQVSLSDLVKYLISYTGLVDYYQKEKGERGRARIENLHELVTACGEFSVNDVWGEGESENKPTELAAFVANTTLEPGESGFDSNSQDCVQMMTLHAAKGLEFPVVFIVGMEDGLLPHQMSLGTFSGLEEERRLCYVGMTRAMKQLYLTYAESRRLNGQSRYNRPSRFIGEIPSECIDSVRSVATISRPVTARINNRRYDFSQSQYNFSKESMTTLKDSDYCNGELLEENNILIGKQVEHELFGKGVLLNIQGQSSTIKVEVKFDKVGTKWLMLQYAKLRYV